MTTKWPSQLRGISTFIRAAEARNFSKAARELGVTPQAVSNQIMQLEALTGTALFRRTTRRISLTDEGLIFYERCRVGIEAIDEGFQSLRNAADDASGLVRISVPHYMSRAYMLPILPAFFDKYPGISIELVAQNEYPDFVGQEIDIAVMSRHVPRDSFIARKVASVRLILCASPIYLKRYGVPKTPEDLRAHRCVVFRHPVTGKTVPWTFKRGKKIESIDVKGSLTTNDSDTQRQAVLQGAGIGQLASFFVSSHLKDASLEALLMNYVAQPFAIYLCMANRPRIPRRISTLFNFLEETLSNHEDFQAIGVRN